MSRHQVRLLSDHALALDDRIAHRFIVNEPAARSELRRLVANVFDANVVGEHELTEHRIRSIAQVPGTHRNPDSGGHAIEKRCTVSGHWDDLESKSVATPAIARVRRRLRRIQYLQATTIRADFQPPGD